MKYKRVCLAGSLYSLLVYLASSTADEIENTFFIFDSYIPKNFTQRFEHVYWINRNKWYFKYLSISWFFFFLLRITKFHWINKSVEIYANDHLPCSAGILFNKKYTMIEDSAGICSHFCNGQRIQHMLDIQKQKTFKFYHYLYGKVYANYFGYGSTCTSVLLTIDDNADYLKGKVKKIIPLNNQWDSYSERKQKLIQNFYNLSTNDIEMMKNAQLILFTQPLYLDGVGIDVHRNVYKKIISRYPLSELLIKTHPRDNFNYQELSDNIKIFQKMIPSQIFNMMGIKFNKAITIFSSAVNSFDYKIQIDWYGTEVDPTIFKIFGPWAPPHNVNLCKL